MGSPTLTDWLSAVHASGPMRWSSPFPCQATSHSSGARQGVLAGQTPIAVGGQYQDG